MHSDSENNAILRARADVDDFDRKIAVTKAEEERLAMERQRWEAERAKVIAFIEMFERYAGDPADGGTHSHGHDGGRSQTQAPKPNGSARADSHVRAAGHQTQTRSSRKRRPPVHRKPPGTPTTYEMVLEALRDAERRGLSGLAPKDIGVFIKQKWWPHLKGSSVGPAAWRMYKDKQIRREGDLYALLAS